MACEKRKVSMLAFFDGADGLVKTEDFCGIGRDALEGGNFIEAAAAGKRRRTRKQFKRLDREIGDYGHENARVDKFSDIVHGFVPEFFLAPGPEKRADTAGDFLFGENVGDFVAFGCVFDNQPEFEFFGHADGSENIIGAVGMRPERDFFL